MGKVGRDLWHELIEELLNKNQTKVRLCSSLVLQEL